MKKFLVVCVASLLACSLVFAQEADDTGAGVALSIIPRVDLSPEFSNGDSELTLGNSSLYTLFEGSISEKLSFSLSNHWMGFYGTDPLMDDTKALYNKPLFSDRNSFLDWAYLQYDLGQWQFTLGKDVLTLGGLEFDAYDWDVHPFLASSLWNELPAYQWGAKVSYLLGEDQALSFQWSTSPFGEKPFSSGLFNYSLGWKGLLFDTVETIWSVTALQKDKDSYVPMISLGQRAELGSFTLGLDFNSKVGYLEDGFSLAPSVNWALGEHFELLLRGGYEHRSDAPAEWADSFIGGGALHWYPLRDSQALRIHAAAAYNSLEEITTIGMGVTWNLNLRIGK